jgi:hypothetical protein
MEKIPSVTENIQFVLPSQRHQAYLSAFQAVAIYIAIAGRCSLVGVARDLSRAQLAHRGDHPDATIIEAFWTSPRQRARRIASEACIELAPGKACGGWIVANVHEARRAIKEIAERQGAPLTDHVAAMTRVEVAIARIEAAIAAAKADGMLSRFHADYRENRLMALAEGRRSLSYGRTVERLKQSIMGAIAEGRCANANGFQGPFHEWRKSPSFDRAGGIPAIGEAARDRGTASVWGDDAACSRSSPGEGERDRRHVR